MRVLLVDDEEDIRKIGKLSLEAVGGFETNVASDANEAIALARSKHPDVILMDVMMPEMDGLAVLAKLKLLDDLRMIPVVFMTAKVQQAEVQKYLSAGAIGVVQKPFDPMTLSAELVRILAAADGAPRTGPS